MSGESFTLNIDWRHNILDAVTIRARGGYEYFEEDGNYIYEIAQWYPRVAAYTDYQGWQHKQFIGRGEFTLELGDFRVEITVPGDHVVAATGVLQNPQEVLSAAQRQRLEQAATATKPVFVVTPEEARENQADIASDKKTWVFAAENVRDFAFASSRKFIWDAMGYSSPRSGATRPAGGVGTLAMSFYPNEAEPLWSQYSTHAVIHTLDVYSSFTFDYPYPVAISVNGPIGGMEYPMICFNKPRPYQDSDKTYRDVRQHRDDHTWERSKYGLISVIIQEVGHNFFPMIVNSDERQWTWMDEGLNTFLQFLAEQAWEEGYPSRRGEPEDIVAYMVSDHKVPIMTNSESLLQFGNNAYAKPATGSTAATRRSRSRVCAPRPRPSRRLSPSWGTRISSGGSLAIPSSRTSTTATTNSTSRPTTMPSTASSSKTWKIERRCCWRPTRCSTRSTSSTSAACRCPCRSRSPMATVASNGSPSRPRSGATTLRR